jgi:4-amino-4-deoxy-L-arabinose transferase-like glycosyltransferase
MMNGDRCRYPWRSGAFWALVCLVIFLTVNNIFWLQRHLLTIPPPWDQAAYLYMSLRYLHALTDGGLVAMVNEFIYGSLILTHTSPLFPLTTVPLYLLFGESRLVAYLTHSIYLLLLLWGVYSLGKGIYGHRAGMVAMFLIATFTGIVHYSRDYLLDFPAAAVVTVGIYAMIQSEEFQRRGWALLFGGMVGFALLTKSMAGVFFVGPVVYAFGCLIRRRQLTLARLTNFLVSVSAAVLAIAVWWGPNFQAALGFLTYHGFGEGSATSPRPLEGESLVLRTLVLYPLFLVNEGMSFFYALLFAGLVLSRGVKTIGRWKRNGPKGTAVRSKEGYLWVWLLIGCAVLTAVPLKNERHTLALLPPLALLLAGYIESLDTRWLRRSVVVIAMMVGTVNYAGTSYEAPLIPKEVPILPPFFFIKHQYSHYRSIRSYLQPSASTQWPIEDILFTLARRAAGIEERNVESGRIQFLNRAQSLSSEAYVQLMYRQLLKREPDETGSRHYVGALGEGKLTREGIFDAFIASSEYRERPSRILVVPNHPAFNAPTLQYYAELHRYPLIFFDYPLSLFEIHFDVDNDPLTRDQLQAYDFVLWKNGGYQSPTLTPHYRLTTRYNKQFYAELLEPDSGFVPLSQTFTFPDDSHIMIFAASYTLK